MIMQVLSVIRNRPAVRKISFIAHSLGGLVARYAIGRLYEERPKLDATVTTSNDSSQMQTDQSMEKTYPARIAGLEPMNFVTFATPHLGSRGHRQVL